MLIDLVVLQTNQKWLYHAILTERSGMHRFAAKPVLPQLTDATQYKTVSTTAIRITGLRYQQLSCKVQNIYILIRNP